MANMCAVIGGVVIVYLVILGIGNHFHRQKVATATVVNNSDKQQ